MENITNNIFRGLTHRYSKLNSELLTEIDGKIVNKINIELWKNPRRRLYTQLYGILNVQLQRKISYGEYK